MTLSDQELNQITKEAISYVHQNFRVGEKSYQKCIQSYLAAATKYQERINGLLDFCTFVFEKQDDGSVTKDELAFKALTAITNYNESLKG